MSAYRSWLAIAALAAIGTFVTVTLPDGTTVSGSGAAGARESYICMTDDGYGRKRPCSAGYKAANPNWRGTDSCMTDDGYGRKRPCSAGYKTKHQN